jgi:hypothetical protein
LIENAIVEREVLEKRGDEDRERMTPAFNNRLRADSYRLSNNPSVQ